MGQIESVEDRPLWKRIVEFPLVAMLMAIALYAVASALAFFIERALPPMPKGTSTAVQTIITVGLTFFTYKIAIRHLGEHPRDDLPGKGAARNLALGLVAGTFLFSAVVGVAALSGIYRITGCCSTAELLKDIFGAAIFAGFMEELLFRGILFRWIEEFGGSWAALIITSVLFGLIHIMNPNATWFSSFAIALEAGVLLGGAYMLTRSLWMPMGLHAAWNFTQGFVFDVPVSGLDVRGLVTAKLSGPVLLSGGPFGLEASVIALVVATAAGIVLVVLAVKSGKSVPPWWSRRRIAPVT